MNIGHDRGVISASVVSISIVCVPQVFVFRYRRRARTGTICFRGQPPLLCLWGASLLYIQGHTLDGSWIMEIACVTASGMRQLTGLFPKGQALVKVLWLKASSKTLLQSCSPTKVLYTEAGTESRKGLDYGGKSNVVFREVNHRWWEKPSESQKLLSGHGRAVNHKYLEVQNLPNQT